MLPGVTKAAAGGRECAGLSTVARVVGWVCIGQTLPRAGRFAQRIPGHDEDPRSGPANDGLAVRERCGGRSRNWFFELPHEK